MKRSEMVKMLHNWYWNNDGKFNASDCLAIVESEGMSPPERVRYTDQDNGNTLCSPEQTWEPEDDSKN